MGNKTIGKMVENVEKRERDRIIRLLRASVYDIEYEGMAWNIYTGHGMGEQVYLDDLIAFIEKGTK